MAKDKKSFVEPIQFDQSQKAAHKQLLTILKSLPRTKITISKDDYICAKSTSLLFRFVDDLEFVFDANKKIIHVRSASRVGYSGFGVNRKRVENIQKKFQFLHQQ